MKVLELYKIRPEQSGTVCRDRLCVDHVAQVSELALLIANLLALSFSGVFGELLTLSRGGPFSVRHGSWQVVPLHNTTARQMRRHLAKCNKTEASGWRWCHADGAQRPADQLEP